jgi:hypothetical protein
MSESAPPPRSPGAIPKRAPRPEERAWDVARGHWYTIPADPDWKEPPIDEHEAPRRYRSFWDRVHGERR